MPERRSGPPTDLDPVAEQLYGLAPEEFVAARNSRAKQARQDGDRELAASIQALAKPNAPAALANQLVRRQRDELAPLLDLGESLRAATAALSGPELRTLGQQRHRLIAALVAQARTLAEADGRAVSGDAVRGLEETLHAALADEDAAAELMAGRLTDALHRSGLGGPELGTASPAGPAASRRVARSGSGRGGSAGSRGAGSVNGHDALGEKRAERARVDRETAQARQRQVEDDRARARDDLAEAREGLARAEADADEARTQLDEAGATVARLREELDRAMSQYQRREHEHDRRRAEIERAQRSVRAAQRRADEFG